MAGIGFKLQELLKKGRFSDRAKAYAFSAVIATGPWLMSILALSLISTLSDDVSSVLGKFRVIVTWCYAISLIYAGIWQMVITRLMADRLYLGDTQALVPGFFTSAVMVSLGSILTALAMFWPLEESLPIRVAAIMVFCFVVLIWHVMIFLGAANDYISVVKAFGAGCLVGVVACLGLGHAWGLFGYLVGFATGQATIWALLASRLLIEFPSDRVINLDIFTAFKKYPVLIGVGMFYNAGLWTDKMVYWFSDWGREYMGYLVAFPPYDRAIFIAYLTIVPTFTVFLITVETNFARAFNDFFAAILTQRNLIEIQVAHDNMGLILDQGLMRILKIQGLVTLVALVFAENLAGLTQLDPESMMMLRIAILAAFLHAVFLSLLLLVLYFDLQKLALALTGTFFGLNFLLTYLSLEMDAVWRGYGYALTALLMGAATYWLLSRRYDDMIFRTFTQGDIPEPSVDDL